MDALCGSWVVDSPLSVRAAAFCILLAVASELVVKHEDFRACRQHCVVQ